MSDDYDAAVTASLHGEAAQSARLGFSVASDTNPDAYAEAQRVARRTGVPVDTALAMPQEIKRQAAIGSIDFDSMAKTSPATAALLADVEKARIAHDDVDNLTGIESALFAFGKFEVGTAKAIASSVPKMNEGLWGLARAGADRLPDVVGVPMAQKFAQYGGMQRDIVDSLMPKSDSVLGNSWYSGMQSLGSNALLLPFAVASGGAAPVLLGMGASTGGQAYGEARDAGRSPNEALAFGASQGVIEAGTEMIGLPALLSTLKPGKFLTKASEYLIKEQGGEQIATHLQDLNEWAVLHPEKTMGDYLTARPDAALQTALSTLFSGGGQLAVVKGIGLMTEQKGQQAEQAPKMAELLTGLNKLAEANLVRGRDAETAQGFFQSALSEGRDAVYITPDALAQSGLAEKMALTIPAVQEQLQTAAESGHDIRIPIADMMAQLAGPELEQALIPHLSTEAGGFTATTAQEYLQSGQAQDLQAEVERVLGEKKGDDSFKASAEAVKGKIQSDLDLANRFTPAVNEAYATLHQNFYAVTAARMGIMPEAMYERFPLRTGAEAMGGKQFDQGGTIADLRHRIEAGIEGQRMRGELAKLKGYKAVEMGDEHGTSYLVLPGVNIRAINPSEQSTSAGSDVFNQGARGSFNPESLAITLLKNADLSTFLHESGHFFMEVQASLADQIQQAAAIHGADTLTAGEREILADSQAVLNWFGVKDLAEWNGLDFEEKRSYHEKFARGFESYLFEGKAPSIELQGLFQRFRAWMLNVYRDLKALNVEITPEVRGVFDRMLATTEQIQLAEQGRSMMPLFESAEKAGMTVAEFAEYQALGTDATNEAIEALQARGLRDMQWIHNARGRVIKQMQKESAARRADVRMSVRTEVMRQPIYQAWAFLTGKIKAADSIAQTERQKSDPDSVDESQDSLFAAIAKLGGINKQALVESFGVDPADKAASGVFGKHVMRAESKGLTIDGMAEQLSQFGYLPLDKHGKWDLSDLEEKFKSELGGDAQYSTAFDYAGQQQQDAAGSDLTNPAALNAGRLDRSSLASMGLPAEVVARLDALKMAKTGALHPDVVAELFGFSSGDELVRSLADAQKPADVIEGMTDQRMLEQYGDLSSEQAIETAADQAIHNDVRARLVTTELNTLAKATGSPKVLASAARDYASAMIARLKVRNILPGQYTSAEARAAKGAQKASKSGDLATAATEKRNQLINLYAAKAAYAAQDEAKAAVKYFKKFDATTMRAKLPADYLAQIDVLLDRYDMRAKSNIDIDRAKSLRTWVQSRLNAGEIPNISESLLTPQERQAYSVQINSRDDEGNLVYPDDDERIKLLADAIDRSAKRSIKDMTVEEVRGLRETVQQIEHLGRLKDKMLTAMEGAGYAATRDLLAATVIANAKDAGKNTRTDNTWLGAKLDGLKQFGASHIKPAIWMRIFDGGQDNGPWWSTVVRPANERATFETTRRASATIALMDLLAPVLKNVSYVDQIGKGKFFPMIGTSLNWEERMAFAFNYGNESNLQRLMGGGIAGVTQALNMAQIHSVLNTLSAAEWQAVQGVWDHFETYRPEIGAKEMRVNGVEPAWIAARPFAIKTSDGQTINLRGGYFPVKFDSKTSLKAQQHGDAQAAKDAMKAAYSAATTQRSFTKARVEEVTGRPLLLNLSGLYSGANDVIHDLAWHEWVIDVNRLLRSESIDGAIREHYGANVKKELTKWRDDIVAGSARLDHGIENAAGWARKFVSSAALTYNVISALMQPLGITQSFSRVGARWVGMGLGQYLSGPVAATRMVKEKSEYMTNRTRTMFRDVNELRNRVNGQTLPRELMGRYGYYLTMQMQMTVDVPTWIGAYEKALAGGHKDDVAIALADQSVKDSQGGGEEVDQSGITRGGPMVKLFTAFYDFMNTQANVLYLKNATAESRADAFVSMATVGLVTPVLAAALRDALIPGDSGDWDEWDKALKKLLTEGLGNLIGMMAFGREFSQAAKALYGDDKGISYSGPTGLRVIPDVGRLAKQIHQGDMDDALRKSLINAIGDVGGIPAVQINRTITGVEALSQGKTTNPTALAFGFQEKR